MTDKNTIEILRNHLKNSFICGHLYAKDIIDKKIDDCFDEIEIKLVTDKLLTMTQEEFAEVYNMNELASLYYDIRSECERQLEYMSKRIAQEMLQNGKLDIDD